MTKHYYKNFHSRLKTYPNPLIQNLTSLDVILFDALSADGVEVYLVNNFLRKINKLENFSNRGSFFRQALQDVLFYFII